MLLGTGQKFKMEGNFSDSALCFLIMGDLSLILWLFHRWLKEFIQWDMTREAERIYSLYFIASIAFYYFKSF